MISNSLTETIRSSKEKFYYKLSTKLANPLRHQKPIGRYSKLGKKVPIIPPLLVTDKFVTNFLEKANLLNEFFSKQCQLLQNNSTLPKSNTYQTENRLNDKERNRLNDITFDNEKLLKIIIRCKQSSWIISENAKAKQSIHNKTTFYYISELPSICNFPR